MQLFGFQEELNKLKKISVSDVTPVLIYGKAHTSKTTLGKTIAKSHFCTNEQGKPCGECKGCKRFDNGNEVDFLYIEDTENKNIITLEKVQLVKDFCLSKPIQNPTKVVMIKDFHKLNHVSQNALLKVLEEPVDFVKFIFTSSNIDFVLDTITSRVILFPMPSISQESLTNYIESHYPDIDDNKKDILKKYSNSIYLVNLFLNEESGFDDVRKSLFDFLLSIKNTDSFTLFTNKYFTENVENWDVIQLVLVSILLDAAYNTLNVENHLTNIDYSEQIQELSNSTTVEKIIHTVEEVVKLSGYLKMNLKQELILNNLSLTLIKCFK